MSVVSVTTFEDINKDIIDFNLWSVEKKFIYI